MSPEAECLVTVVVPVKNRADRIEGCLRSVLDQGLSSLECIVVDSCSSDGTSDLVEGFIRSTHDGGVRWVHLIEPDAGQADAIAKGLRMSSGRYFTWLNADDRWLQGFLSSAVQVLEADRSLALVSGGVRVVDASGAAVTTYMPRRLTSTLLLTATTSVVQPATLMRTDLVRQAGSIEPGLHYAMDYDLWIRVLRLGEMRAVPEVWAEFLLDSTTKSGTAGVGFALEEWRVLNMHGAPRISQVRLAVVRALVREVLKKVARRMCRVSA